MDQRQFFLRDILTVIFKRMKLIVILPVFILVVVTLLSYLWPSTYESVAKVQLMRGREVSQSDPMVTQNSSAVSMITLGIEDLNSEIELMHSRNVLESVVRYPETDFADGDQLISYDPDEKQPEFVPLYKDAAFPYGGGFLAPVFKAGATMVKGALYVLGLWTRPAQPWQDAMRQLDERLITTPIRDSYNVEVRVQLGSPERSQEVLDMFLRAYKAHHIEVFSNNRSLPFFEAQLIRVQSEMQKAQNELQEFLHENDISLLNEEKELLLEDYRQAQKILTQLTQAENVVSGDDPDSSVINLLASETDSTVVREMQLRLLELILERNRAMQSLGPNHPSLQSLMVQISKAKDNVIEAIATTKAITNDRIMATQDRLAVLNSTRAQFERQEKDVELLTADYELYSQKVEESRISDELAKQSISNVRVASAPSLPIDPVSPRKLLNMILALVGGLVFAVALAFFFDYLDHGLKTPEDVEFYCKVPVLASFFGGPRQPLDARESERLSIVLDSIQTGDGPKVFEVTSSVPGEGADQVAQALAESYAEQPDSRTLLIDLAGTVARAKNSRNGLTDVLLNPDTYDEVFGVEDQLTIVGAGSQPGAHSIIWSGAGMDELIAKLRGRYRYTIFNVSPVLTSHDALKIARYADGVVIAIKADATRREVVTRARDMFGDRSGKVVGAVMTQRTQAIPSAVYRRI